VDTPLANRLRKRVRHLERWAELEGLEAYRIFDRDLPSYHFAVDRYGPYALVHEYPWRPEGGDQRHDERRAELFRALEEVLPIARDRVIMRTHQRHRWGESQYARRGHDLIVEVREKDLRFEVNLGAGQDTGLFLDHRRTRGRVREWAQGRSVLNLFCYTGAFTAAAAAGGARRSISVDLSAPYLAWAERNLERNRLRNARHRLVRADVLQWLRQAARAPDRFDLIVVDPPSFSTSKRMAGAFEVERDHATLLLSARSLLAPGGRLIFSTTFQQFHLDRAALTGLLIDEMTPRSLPLDFRGGRPHRCWSMVAKP
jgi:23S rRNA (cytosine1962-C5)-methyltransferase